METQRSFGMIAADVRAAQGGNAGAMNRILTDVQDMVYYNCLRILRNEQNALDASQEILITVYRKLGSLSDPTAYIGWVKRITANHCKNRLCKVNKEFLLSVNEEGEDPFAAFEDTDEQRIPEKVIDNAETRRMIVELIDRLPDEQRMCVMLYYYDEMKTREIAETLGVSEGTVKSRLNYARKSIKEGVQAYEKQGIKLYGLSPILFLTYFLRASGKATAAPFAIQMSAAGTAAGTATASAAGAAAGSTAGTTAGTAAAATTAAAAAKATGLGAFLATTAGKIVAGIAAAAVLGGAVAGTAVAVSRPSRQTRPEPTQSAYVQQQNEDPYAGLFATRKPAAEAQQPVQSQAEEPGAVPVAPVPEPSDVWVERFCTYRNDVFNNSDNSADVMFACDLDGDGVDEQISYRFSGESWSDGRSLTITAGDYRCVLTGENVECMEGVSGAMVVDLDPESPYRNLIINTDGEIYGIGVCFALHPEDGKLVCDLTLENSVFWYNGKIYHETYFSDRLRSHDSGCRRLLGDTFTPDSDWYTWNEAYCAHHAGYDYPVSSADGNDPQASDEPRAEASLRVEDGKNWVDITVTVPPKATVTIGFSPQGDYIWTNPESTTVRHTAKFPFDDLYPEVLPDGTVRIIATSVMITEANGIQYLLYNVPSVAAAFPGPVLSVSDSDGEESDSYDTDNSGVVPPESFGVAPRELHVIRDLPCTIDGVAAVIPAGSNVTIYGDHAHDLLVAVKTEDGRIAVIRVEPYESDDWEHWCPFTINGIPQDDYFEEDTESGNYWG